MDELESWKREETELYRHSRNKIITIDKSGFIACAEKYYAKRETRKKVGNIVSRPRMGGPSDSKWCGMVREDEQSD